MQGFIAATVLFASLLISTVLSANYHSNSYCSKPTIPSNGYIHKGYQKTYEVGSVVVYACKSGYELWGRSTITCKKSGHHEYWNSYPPQCKRSSNCPKLSSPSYGYVKYNGVYPGSQAYYYCQDGYHLKGDSSRKCQSNGVWAGEEPYCVGVKKCGDPGTPHYGGRSVTGYTPYSVVKYYCNSGYYLVGSSKRKCQTNGQWTGSLPYCKPIGCGKLSSPSYGRVEFSSTKVGSKATYSCSHGYVLVGDSMRKCQSNGQWSGEAPICKRIHCGSLKAPIYGYVKYSGKSVGSTAHYFCREGYVLRGDSRRMCQSNGEWSGDTPSCHPVDCGDPGTPKNGQRFLTGSTPGSVVKYSCNPGYILVGSSQRKCQSNGEWSSSLPSCRLIDCGPLNDPQYGRVDVDGTTVNEVATYYCNPGFMLVGDSRRTCQSNGRWSGDEPVCKIVDCGPLPAPDNGFISITNTTLGSEALFKCANGYLLLGDEIRVCLENGTWSGAQPTCVPVECATLVDPDNGRVSYTDRILGSVATYTCNDGFELAEGDETRECLASGQWSGEEPICRLLDCGPLDNPENGRVRFDDTTVGEVANYDCNSGYVLDGDSQRKCQSNGRWSGDEPVCIIVDCGELPPPENGDISFSDTTFNSKATFECSLGFLLVGDEVRVCQADGQWSGKQPICVPVECATLLNPENGEVEVTGQTEGSVATYTCNDGFMIVGGDMQRECLVTGEWSGNEPTCELVDCGELSPPENGDISIPDTTFGSEATFECSLGFLLVGDEVRVCQADGQWSGKQPICVSVECATLVNPENGEVEVTGQTAGSVATYTCNDGFMLVRGDMRRECLVTGEWSGNEPTCEPIECDPLPDPKYGSVDVPDTILGSVATYRCDKGFQLIGGNIRICNIDGWSGEEPTCRPKSKNCPKLDNPDYGQVSFGSTVVGSSAFYSCNHGFVLVGTSVRTCQSDGTWSDEAPICKRVHVGKDCGYLDHPDYGYVFHTGTRHGSIAYYSCYHGYKLVGASTRNCLSSGLWSGEAPVCVVKKKGYRYHY